MSLFLAHLGRYFGKKKHSTLGSVVVLAMFWGVDGINKMKNIMSTYENMSFESCLCFWIIKTKACEMAKFMSNAIILDILCFTFSDSVGEGTVNVLNVTQRT